MLLLEIYPKTKLLVCTNSHFRCRCLHFSDCGCYYYFCFHHYNVVIHDRVLHALQIQYWREQILPEWHPTWNSPWKCQAWASGCQNGNATFRFSIFKHLCFFLFVFFVRLSFNLLTREWSMSCVTLTSERTLHCRTCICQILLWSCTHQVSCERGGGEEEKGCEGEKERKEREAKKEKTTWQVFAFTESIEEDLQQAGMSSSLHAPWNFHWIFFLFY